MPSRITLSAAPRQKLRSLAVAADQGILRLSRPAAGMKPILLLSAPGPHSMISKPTMPLAAILCVCLGACTDEPSESAMREAASDLMNLQAQIFRVGPSGGASAQAPSFTTFRKIGCEPAPPSLGGYTCGYEASINGGPTVRGRGRFYRKTDGTLAMTE